MTVAVELARREDVDSVLTLLDRHGLPVEGASAIADSLVVARLDGQIVGAAGLELYAEGALLRSVVVDASVQGQGIGHQLIDAALTLARAGGQPMIFLLTTTAGDFFPRFGFERIDRADVPASVRQSVELRSACPASAIVMRKQLR